ncbi:mitogen-activated protein kinase kinase kinase kinase 4 isoform x6 [Limosa lapponica baueri]|uniref:non-specific serine/threonine protein kinase n=1 Tax=Limosa lapponica baueri TaxID=1758121 RepID=A0A2I0T5N5_LIMLA|nr:mitogen-activated protein kinase kinase kinase kinase 4 isoform x6 [Limosa lapponica baueri]
MKSQASCENIKDKIQSSIQPHAIIILPNTDGMELLVCYEDEGVYVNTYGRITKDVVLQWGEMPTSVDCSSVLA